MVSYIEICDRNAFTNLKIIKKYYPTITDEEKKQYEEDTENQIFEYVHDSDDRYDENLFEYVIRTRMKKEQLDKKQTETKENKEPEEDFLDDPSVYISERYKKYRLEVRNYIKQYEEFESYTVERSIDDHTRFDIITSHSEKKECEVFNLSEHNNRYYVWQSLKIFDQILMSIDDSYFTFINGKWLKITMTKAINIFDEMWGKYMNKINKSITAISLHKIVDKAIKTWNGKLVCKSSYVCKILTLLGSKYQKDFGTVNLDTLYEPSLMSTEDFILDFMSKTVEETFNKNQQILGKDLYDSYQNYCSKYDIEPTDIRQFGKLLVKNNFDSKKTSKGRMYLGFIYI